MRRSPNFFIIGAPKCGTTSLAAWLSEHSQVFMSRVKEPHHFYSPHNPEMSLRNYEELFAESNDAHIAIGEASVWYLYGAQVAIPRIERYCKESPPLYIVCLRSPAQMAPSLHAQKIFSGNELIENFSEAWAVSERRYMGEMVGVYGIPEGDPGHMAYKYACRIGSQIELLLSMVPAERVMFIFLDDIVDSPESVWRSVQDFLSLDYEKREVFENKNPATVRRYPRFNRFLMLLSLIKRRLGLKFGTGLLLPLVKANSVDKKYDALAGGLEAELRGYFEGEVKKIEQVTGRSLESWRR